LAVNMMTDPKLLPDRRFENQEKGVDVLVNKKTLSK